MFGSKSLNVPFLFKCDPRPPSVPNIAPKTLLQYALLHIVCAFDQVSKVHLFVHWMHNKLLGWSILNYDQLLQLSHSQAGGEVDQCYQPPSID